MQKLKSIVFVAGLMLLILAAVVGYLSIKYLSAILLSMPVKKCKKTANKYCSFSAGVWQQN